MRVEFAEGFDEDLDRIKEHLVSHQADVEARISAQPRLRLVLPLR